MMEGIFNFIHLSNFLNHLCSIVFAEHTAIYKCMSDFYDIVIKIKLWKYFIQII